MFSGKLLIKRMLVKHSVYIKSKPENCRIGRRDYSISEVHLMLFKAYITLIKSYKIAY